MILEGEYYFGKFHYCNVMCRLIDQYLSVRGFIGICTASVCELDLINWFKRL